MRCLDAPEKLLLLTSVLERGWTRAMVEMFLGVPDQLRQNPRHRSGALMRFYALSRIEAAEQSVVFVERKAKAQERAKRGVAVAVRKYQELLDRVEALHIDVPKYGDEDVVWMAIDHYHRLWASRGEYSKYASLGDSPAFLGRITVNFLRHACSRYEDEFEQAYGEIGAENARRMIRGRVYGAIARRYPQYEGECDRQLQERAT